MDGLPQAVIFDFDGVVVDSEPVHYRAFQAVLEPLGLGFGWDRYMAEYIGYDDRDGFRAAYADAGLAKPEGAEMEELVAAKTAAFEREAATGLPVFEGVEALVRALAEEGVPLAVCSGALRGEITPTLDRLGLREVFRALVSAEDVAHSKPDPESYSLAVRQLAAATGRDLSPTACAAIEDTPAGIASARGAGLRVLAVAHTHPPEALAEAQLLRERLADVTLADWAAAMDTESVS